MGNPFFYGGGGHEKHELNRSISKKIKRKGRTH